MNVKVGNDKIEISNVTVADWLGSKTVVGKEDVDYEASES